MFKQLLQQLRGNLAHSDIDLAIITVDDPVCYYDHPEAIQNVALHQGFERLLQNSLR